MLDEYYNELKKKMENALHAMKKDVGIIRTGRASLSILDNIRVEYFGTSVPINQVASLSIPEANLILVRPWDVATLKDIERALLASDLGINPISDGKLIKLQIPSLTEERRKELAKKVWKIAEEYKTSIRLIRREGNEKTRKMEKNKELSEDDSKKWQDKIQKLTDDYIEKVGQVADSKEKEIMSI
ncbi:MAG: ribosome recycling factor [Candidatus Fischerbacteria bacterium RBG_13_37_8]|uniref:Ribosome-recycling factor n=1 Tax=Candidatus Fischerbacteria bacterium RBG_13_37_8 TaxID=1817863 RepID=A0A1F5VHC7_9BACT|nr:MAG: ribosome recycling factor [Candidatus Fischerbacteria bacterium RBG_13_37_8]